MDTASWQFLLYGIAVAIVSNFSRSKVWRASVLFVASLLFLYLMFRSITVLLPLVGLLAFGYVCICFLQRKMPRMFSFSVVGVIVIYIWLKKYTFLSEAIFLHISYTTVGLSYIFFRVLHLLIETSNGGLEAPPSLFAYLIYNLNFTTFISGPIQRFEEFARNIFSVEVKPLGVCVVGLQLDRMIRGFFKVNVMAFLFDMIRQNALGTLAH